MSSAGIEAVPCLHHSSEYSENKTIKRHFIYYFNEAPPDGNAPYLPDGEYETDQV